VIVALMDRERTMEEILREIREIYAREERADRDRERQRNAGVIERLRRPSERN